MTDAQWAVIAPLLPLTSPVLGGRPPVHHPRAVVDTILYVLVSGCQWRMLPRDLVPWQTAYGWFRAWTATGVWDRVHDTLRDQVRVTDGRDPQPSAAVLDSKWAKSSEGGEHIGYDAEKRVRGRKPHLLVDTNGLVLTAVVHSASVQDRAGAKLVLAGVGQRFPLLGLVWVDGGYVNSVDRGLVGWAASTHGIELVAVPRNADVKGFQVLLRRWVVERTFGWLSRCRRLARDYERKTDQAEAMIKVAMIRMMAARLAGEELPEPRGDVEREATRRLVDDLNQNELPRSQTASQS